MSYWYHLDFDAIARMPMTAIQAYLDAIPTLQAETRIALSELVSLPYLKSQDSRATVLRWVEEAFGEQAQIRSAGPSPAQLALIGIQYVSVPAGTTTRAAEQRIKDVPAPQVEKVNDVRKRTRRRRT